MESTEQKNKYISLAEASEQTLYSQEYLSLRARQGKLRAIKMGRDWVTTKEWADEYAVQAQSLFLTKEKKLKEYVSLQKAASYTKYSQEYLSLRVRQGKLKAKKMGRNWVTTKEWLDEYAAKVKSFAMQRQKNNIDMEVAKEKIPPHPPFTKWGEIKIDGADRAERIDIKEELNSSQPPFKKGGVKSLPARLDLKGKAAEVFLKPFVWLGINFEKLAVKLRERGVMFSLRWQALEEAIRIARVAPALVSKELRYFKIAVFFFLLAAGAGTLAQENVRAGLADGLTAVMSKIGELTIETPGKISGALGNIKSLPTLLYGKEGEDFKGEIKDSVKIIFKGGQDTMASLANAGNELVWQVSSSVRQFVSWNWLIGSAVGGRDQLDGQSR